MATVSVIVTSYSIQDYLAQCLDSVCSQTLADLEIIVVDDASSDSSPDIIREYAARDSRIVPVLLSERSPGGVATPANIGLDKATGTWVGFADGDDVCEPTMFEALVEAAERNDSDLAMGDYRLFHDDLDDTSLPADSRRWQDLDDYYPLDVNSRQEFLRFVAVPWRKLYRRSFLEEHHIRFPVGDYFYEDNPFHWFCLLQADALSLVPQVLCYHRVGRAGQTMIDTADERTLRIFRHHDIIHDFLEKNGYLDSYQIPLLVWTMSQMEWVSRRTPPELRRQLFQILRGIFTQYNQFDLDQALSQGEKGAFAKQLTKYAFTDNFARFQQNLDANAESQGLLMRGWYHLRYSGVRRTAAMTLTYVHDQLGGDKLPLLGRSLRGRDVSNEQLMFGLGVIQHRLAELEREVHDLHERLERPDDGK